MFDWSVDSKLNGSKQFRLSLCSCPMLANETTLGRSMCNLQCSDRLDQIVVGLGLREQKSEEKRNPI